MTDTSPKQQDRAFGAGGRLSTVFLLTVILLAFGMHICQLDAKSLWIDEGLSVYRAHQDLPTILSNAIVIQGFLTYDTHPPLYFVLLHLLIRVTGNTDFTFRFLSVAWSVLLVPLFYVSGKRLLGRRVGLWSALIAAVSPVYLWYSQESRPYLILVFLTLLSNYALLRIWQSSQESERHPRRVIVWAVAYLLTTAAAVFTHYGAIFVLFFQWVVALGVAIWLRRLWLTGLLAAATLFAAPFLPFVLTRLQTPAERGYRFVPLWEIARDLWNAFSLGIAVRLDAVIWLDCLFLLVFLFGLVMIGRGRTKTRLWAGLYLLGYLLIPTLALYLLSHLKPIYEGVRHLLTISPAYYLILGAGFDALFRRFRYLAIAVTLVLAGGVAYSTFNHFCDPTFSKDDIRSMATYVKHHMGAQEVLVMSEPILSPLWEYYYGQDLRWTALPQFPFEPGEDTLNQVAALVDTYDGIWFAYGPPTDRDRKGLVNAWLHENLFQINDVSFRSVNNVVGVAHYLTRPPILSESPTTERETNLDFGKKLLLLGHDGLTGQIHASDQLKTTLYWRVLDRPEEDYSFSLRLVDEEGLRWSQYDIVPFNGFYPTSSWEPGTIVAQTFPVPAPYGLPPGQYSWELRVYSPYTFRDVEVFDHAGESVGSGGLIGTAEVAATPAILLPEMPIQYRRQEEFAGVTRLVGYDLAQRGWRAGQTFHLDLYWDQLVPASEDFSVLLQIIDANTGTVLADGAYPMGETPAGSIMRQQCDLVIPPEAAGRRCSLMIQVQNVATGTSLGVAPPHWPFKSERLALAQVQVAAETRIFDKPYMQYPLEAHLGQQVEFLGYDLENRSVEPGGAVELVLYWQASSEMERSYTVFVHMLDDTGVVWAQGDGLPCGGARLTPGWVQGEVIVDRHTIDLGEDTQPGHYRLVWGMYDASTGARLHVFDAEGNFLGDVLGEAELEVVP